MNELERPYHPIADIFPMMTESERVALVDDMRQNGYDQTTPIVMYEGKILDGRNRWEAAQGLGINPPTVQYEGDDPLGFVIRHNLTRRHLSEAPRRRHQGMLLVGVVARQAAIVLHIHHRLLNPRGIVGGRGGNDAEDGPALSVIDDVRYGGRDELVLPQGAQAFAAELTGHDDAPQAFGLVQRPARQVSAGGMRPENLVGQRRIVVPGHHDAFLRGRAGV